MDPPIGDGALAEPGLEHGANRGDELVVRVGRHLEQLLELLGQRAEVAGAEFDVQRDTGLSLGLADCLLEPLAGQARDDVAVHLQEAPVGVPREALVA